MVDVPGDAIGIHANNLNFVRCLVSLWSVVEDERSNALDSFKHRGVVECAIGKSEMVHGRRTDQPASFAPLLEANICNIWVVVRVSAIFPGSERDEVKFGALSDGSQHASGRTKCLVVGMSEYAKNDFFILLFSIL